MSSPLDLRARTVGDSLHDAARALAPGSGSPRLDAELLLGKILGLSRSALIARGDATVDADSARAFARLIALRLRGTPVAYLTGTREFWSLPLRVTPDVLVPRPETETLVELALQRLPEEQAATALDLGTGSGAVALAIASERPRVTLTAVDICPRALTVARQNARGLKLDRIDWRLGSWYEPVHGERFDLIVANPPYVAAADPALARLAAEPSIALSGGPTGLEAVASIAAGAAAHLRGLGWLIVEHGSDQADAVAELFHRHGFTSIRSHADFSGNPRVTLGTIHSPLEGPS
jgi:release factor glutamine methyltransferase